jgi:hypothetical protein
VLNPQASLENGHFPEASAIKPNLRNAMPELQNLHL